MKKQQESKSLVEKESKIEGSKKGREMGTKGIGWNSRGPSFSREPA